MMFVRVRGVAVCNQQYVESCTSCYCVCSEVYRWGGGGQAEGLPRLPYNLVPALPRHLSSTVAKRLRLLLFSRTLCFTQSSVAGVLRFRFISDCKFGRGKVAERATLCCSLMCYRVYVYSAFPSRLWREVIQKVT
jgi:hypothetical protein